MAIGYLLLFVDRTVVEGAGYARLVVSRVDPDGFSRGEVPESGGRIGRGRDEVCRTLVMRGASRAPPTLLSVVPVVPGSSSSSSSSVSSSLDGH